MRLTSRRAIAAPLATCLLAFGFTAGALAQGTATGPTSTHIVDPGPEVTIGDPTNPFPIDLDPTGPPWTKILIDPNLTNVPPGGGPLDITEHIVNVGTEDWLDWHEHILPDASGAFPGIWNSVSMFINGNPITFNAIGIGTENLWLDTFSQPVQPGDVLTIRKRVELFFAPPVPGPPVLVIEEYPTPEPASLALLGLGALAVMRRQQH